MEVPYILSCWGCPVVSGTPTMWGCRDLLAGDKRRTEVRLKAFQQRVDEAEGTMRM